MRIPGSIEQFFLRTITKEKGILFHCLKFPLSLLAWLYWLLFLIKKKITRPCRIQASVISVGNLIAGGNGKTPFTLFLAKYLSKKHKVAVISRAYRSQAEKKSCSVVSAGKGPLLEASFCGDEPYLIAKRLPHLLVIVGNNKKKCAQLAQDMGATIVLLDDGMQTFSLQKDCEIVLLDAKNPFSNSFLLPRGLLREPLQSLSRADLIVLHNAKQRPSQLIEKLCKYTQAEILCTQVSIEGFWDLEGNEYSLNKVQSKKVAAFCAIAKPQRFFETLESLHIQPVAYLTTADHLAPSSKEFDIFIQKAKENHAHWIICTEKDAVKFSLEHQWDIKIVYLKISLKLTWGQSNLDRFLLSLEA